MNKLPNNKDAEQALLGSMILSEEAIADAVILIKKEDFFHKTHSDIFEMIVDIYEKNSKVDVVMLVNKLSILGILDKIGGEEYIDILVNKGTLYYNAKEYAKIVKEQSLRRNLILGANQIIKSSNEEVDEKKLIELSERLVFDVTQSNQQSTLVKASEIIKDVLKELKKRSENSDSSVGLPTRFADLDTKTNGLQDGSLILIAARPSMGKTSLAMNIVENIALKTDSHICVFSLEMTKDQLMQRLISSASMVKLEKIITGTVGSDEWADIQTAIHGFSKSNLYIDDTAGITITELRSKLRRYVMKHKKVDLVVVDYLQLMNGVSGENRQMEISYISRGLKEIAKEMNCPVIALSQLSREPDKRKDHRPLLSDLRESGSIEQDADLVMFIYRGAVYPDVEDNPKVAELIISKQRNGATGTIKLTWLGEYAKFSSYYGES